jgi:hypothetical protein
MGDETASRTRHAAAVVRAIDILRSVPMPAARLTDDISRRLAPRAVSALQAQRTRASPLALIFSGFQTFPTKTRLSKFSRRLSHLVCVHENLVCRLGNNSIASKATDFSSHPSTRLKWTASIHLF